MDKEIEKLKGIEQKFSEEIEKLRKEFIEVLSGRKEYDSSYYEENFDEGDLSEQIFNDIDVSDEVIERAVRPYNDQESMAAFWKEEYKSMFKAFWILMDGYTNPMEYLY